MQRAGHTRSQLAHPVHVAASMTMTAPAARTAPSGQTLRHIAHPVQQPASIRNGGERRFAEALTDRRPPRPR